MHQYQKILQAQYQRKLIDQYADNEALLKDIELLYQQWVAAQNQLDSLKSKANNREAEVSLLQYQYQELEELDLKDNEWNEMCQQHQKLHNAKDLIQQGLKEGPSLGHELKRLRDESLDRKAKKISSLIAIIGLFNLPVIKYSVDWWNTLHQPSSITLTSAPTILAFLHAILIISKASSQNIPPGSGVPVAGMILESTPSTSKVI